MRASISPQMKNTEKETEIMETRKSRSTVEERAVHKEAVRTALADGTGDARQTQSTTPLESGDRLMALLTALSNGECKGVKGATAYKIQQFAQEKGLMK